MENKASFIKIERVYINQSNFYDDRIILKEMGCPQGWEESEEIVCEIPEGYNVTFNCGGDIIMTKDETTQEVLELWYRSASHPGAVGYSSPSGVKLLKIIERNNLKK